MNKTLIGKDNFLFLFNEIDCHCTNDLKINDVNLSQYINHNYKLFVYPDKCIMYKNKLPDNVLVDYRPSVNFYKNLEAGFPLQVLVPLSLHCGLFRSIPNAKNTNCKSYKSNLFHNILNLLQFNFIKFIK